MRLYPPWK